MSTLPPTISPAMARRIEIWPTDRLVPYAKNARTHSPEQVAQIAASIVEFGFVNPILVDSTDGIIAGHGRLLAARKLGLAEVPVVVLDHLSETQRRAYIIADNKLALNAGWDDELLRGALESLDADGFDLALVGFSDEELAALLARAEPDATAAVEEEAVPEPPAQPVTQPGDVWLIGKHRLICGDCRDAAVVEKLMAGARRTWRSRRRPTPRSASTIPSSGFKPVPPEEYVEWFRAVAAGVESVLAPDGSYFLNIKEHADEGERNLYVMDLVLAHRRQWGWRFVDEFCWRKTDNGVPGGWQNRFKNAWEPVFHFCRQQQIKFRAGGGGSRVGGLLRLLARQPEIELRERAAGDRRARAQPPPRQEPGAGSAQAVADDGRQARRPGAAEQRDRGQERVEPGIALRAIPARAGRVLREGVLRRRRRGLRSVHGQRDDAWPRRTCWAGRHTAARSARLTAT